MTTHGLDADRLSVVFDAVPVALLVFDRDLVMVHANPAYLQAVGRTLEEIAGRRVFDVFPDDPANPGQARAPDSALSVAWSSAGHPPPLMVGPEGSVEVLSVEPGVMLGIYRDVPRSDATTTVPAGAALLLYTDGLVERREQPLHDGIARLVEVVSQCLRDGVRPDRERHRCHGRRRGRRRRRRAGGVPADHLRRKPPSTMSRAAPTWCPRGGT